MEELKDIEEKIFDDLTIVDMLEEEAKKRASKHIAGILRKQESLDKVLQVFSQNSIKFF